MSKRPPEEVLQGGGGQCTGRPEGNGTPEISTEWLAPERTVRCTRLSGQDKGFPDPGKQKVPRAGRKTAHVLEKVNPSRVGTGSYPLLCPQAGPAAGSP